MILFLRFLIMFSFDWKDISNMKDSETVDHISKHLEFR